MVKGCQKTMFSQYDLAPCLSVFGVIFLFPRICSDQQPNVLSGYSFSAQDILTLTK